MTRKFRVDASKKVMGAHRLDQIKAAKGEDIEDPRIDELSDLQDRVEEDFSYILAGVERLGREGMYDDALDLLNKLSDTFNSAIGVIGGEFEDDRDITDNI